MQKVKVYGLSFYGNMEKRQITVEDFPKKILKVDDWFGPQIGELCFNQDGKLDVVKDIKWGDTRNGLFKPHKIITFENNEMAVADSLVQRVEVKRGKVFIFNGRPFVHQEALDGGYIEKMAAGKPITEYEYEIGK